MSRKHVVKGFLSFNAVSATTTQTSILTNVSNMDSASYHVKFSAANSGEFKVQARNGEYRPDETSSGWYDLNFGVLLSVTSETDVLIILNSLPFDDVRLVWTPSSGSGTMTAKLTMKTVGA